MDQRSVAAKTWEGQHGAESPDGVDDGLTQLRRWSDCMGRQPGRADTARESAYRAALDVATATLKAYDGGTATHSDDVITLSLALGQELDIEASQRPYLLAAAELHDIGKVGIPSDVLRKAGPLEEAEWAAMREHTVTGERILGAVPELSEVARIVRHCHERWDGDGYPDGLRGEQIPLAARIVFCADAFHAIRCARPYRIGSSAAAALAEVRAHSGTQFDPDVVDALGRVTERLRKRRRTNGWISGGKRSQRLAALLLALAVSGSAVASTGGFQHLPFAGGDEKGSSAGPLVDCGPANCVDTGLLPGAALERLGLRPPRATGGVPGRRLGQEAPGRRFVSDGPGRRFRSPGTSPPDDGSSPGLRGDGLGGADGGQPGSGTGDGDTNSGADGGHGGGAGPVVVPGSPSTPDGPVQAPPPPARPPPSVRLPSVPALPVQVPAIEVPNVPELPRRPLP